MTATTSTTTVDQRRLGGQGLVVSGQGDDVVPIPGTKRRRFLEQNVRVLGVRLDADAIARTLGNHAALVVGARAPRHAGINREAPPVPP